MTTTSRGDRAALQSKILMIETSRFDTNRFNFCRMLSAGISKTNMSNRKVKEQSDPEAPVVRVTDLTKSHGDTVQVDIDHRLNGYPIMGNQDARGKEDELTESQYTVSLDMARYPLKVGSKLDQQRRPWQLVKRAKRSIREWSERLDTEICLFHAMGARGDYMAEDIILPLEGYTDPDGSSFDEMVVNPLSPPTDNRSFFCGSDNTVNCIDPTLGFSSGKPANGMTALSAFSIESVRRLKQIIEEMPNPPSKARLEVMTSKGYKMTTPMFVLVVTPRMWESMRTQPGFNDYAQLVANALKRCAGWDHPLFQGDMLMVDDILVCKTPLPVRHKAGGTVMVRDDNKDGTIRPAKVPAGFDIDRGVLIGGQMLAHCFGRTVSGYSWSMETEKYDYMHKMGICIGRMSGMKKITIRNRDGYLYDNGCITVFGAVESRPD